MLCLQFVLARMVWIKSLFRVTYLFMVCGIREYPATANCFWVGIERFWVKNVSGLMYFEILC